VKFIAARTMTIKARQQIKRIRLVMNDNEIERARWS